MGVVVDCSGGSENGIFSEEITFFINILEGVRTLAVQVHQTAPYCKYFKN